MSEREHTDKNYNSYVKGDDNCKREVRRWKFRQFKYEFVQETVISPSPSLNVA